MKNHFWTIIVILLFFGCDNQKEVNENKQNFEKTWWKEGILYQIYPQSFKDTDGDGFGDFKGVIEKLDYVESLGVNMVWMNPFFESPLVDNGYDVADYRAIHPRYGTMEDFQTMLDGFHERDVKFVLDVVVNHSSNEHEWFKQASSSRDNKYYN
ncbi:MAG: alpha-amylase family glycosyl hydrolase, partial [Saprospiraceae bacterium]